ncbi:MAG TPA: hypothetical protein VF042_06420 [Gemmatimonadaceae bacterium]
MQRFIYLIAFLIGLALAVQVMLHGVERWKRRRSTKPSAAINPPTVAAFLAGAGASGYLFSTRSSFSSPVILVVSLIIGAAAFAGMTVLMAKWALRSPAPPHDDDDINGQVATVSRTILPGIDGEITWNAWGQRHVMTARSVNDSEITAGTEVVIDVVEDDVARVELWSVVEQRL